MNEAQEAIREEAENIVENEAMNKAMNEAVNDAAGKAKQAHQEAVKEAVNAYIREREAEIKREQDALKRQKEEAEAHKTRFTGQPFALNCGDWEATDAGVYKVTVNAKGVETRAVACPHPIMPVARLINLDNGTEKLCIAFYRDGRWQEITADCTVCYNKQQITSLSGRGVLVTSENARHLVQYLADVAALNMNQTEHGAAIPVIRSISRMGWCSDGFVPYVEDIRYDGESEYDGLAGAVHTEGNRDAYMAYLKELRKNKTVRLLISASAASALLEKLGVQPFILHLWGPTGVGKSVSLKVAASIWGNPANGALVRTMNMTLNAMARTACTLRNLPFFADEMQQVKTQTGSYDKFIMCFTEGIDRSRAKADGGIETLKTWQNCMISTGEEPLTRENSGGGAKNRVIELEASHDLYRSGYEVSSFVDLHYGWLGKEFTEELAQYSRPHLQGHYRMKLEELMASIHTTGKQASAMAVILQADNMLSEAFFDDEEPLTPADVACYLPNPDTVDAAERAYQWCLDWLDRNQNRFTASGNYGEIWGRMGDGFAMVNKSVLEEEMRKAGYEYDAVSRRWGERGYILRDKDGSFRHSTSAYGRRGSYIKLNTDIDGQGIGVLVDVLPPAEFQKTEHQLEYTA